MSVAAGRNSLPYVILATVGGGIVMFAIMFTIADPIMQNLFASPSYEASTSWNANLLSWFVSAWEVVLPVVVLLAILVEVWVYSRRGGLQ